MAKPPPSLTPARVVLAGYYGFGNVGDEALLYVLLGWLARYPLEPWVLSADPAGTRRRYGVRAVNRWSPPAVVRALRRADLLILGGGGLLQDATSRRSLLYYLGLLSLARLQGVPVMLIGQGIGPIRRRWLRMRTARALQGAVYLSVRDPESLAQLRAWGIGESRLALGPDPALSLSLDPDPLDSAAARPPTPRRTRPVLGVSPVPPPPDRREAVSTALASALDELQERLGMEVVFLPFHPRADLAFSLELARRLRRPATVLRLEEVNAPQALALVAECAVLWGARLHALEFALLAGVPFAGFLYDPKVSSFIRRLDSQTPESESEPELELELEPLPRWEWDELEPAALVEATERLWERREALRPALLEAAASLRRAAQAALHDAAGRLEGLLGLQPPAAERTMTIAPPDTDMKPLGERNGR